MEAMGLPHLMDIYKKALQSVEFAGPTYFHPILEEAIKISTVARNQGSNSYQVLLILTDGEIHDMDQTVELLVNNANLPLSLIIVGVGQANFANMERLDGDSGLYNARGQKSPRDIVQFVPFRDVKMNPELLTKELLAELPGQVVQYMNLIGKPPGKPNVLDVEQMLPKNNGPQGGQIADMLGKVHIYTSEENNNNNVNPYG